VLASKQSRERTIAKDEICIETISSRWSGGIYDSSLSRQTKKGDQLTLSGAVSQSIAMFNPSVVFFSILFCISICSSQSTRPVLRFGRTTSKCGTLSLNAVPQDLSYQFWTNYTNNILGGINVGGTIYNVQIVEYNDASDPVIVGILYDHLINVDKVDALFSPFNSGLALAAVQALNASGSPLPMVFAGGGTANIFGVAKNSWGTVLLNTNVSFPCINYFASQGAKTAAIIYPIGDLYNTGQANAIYSAGAAAGISFVLNITFISGAGDWNTIAQQLQTANADLLFFMAFSVDAVAALPILKKANIYPKATYYTGDI